MRCIAAFLVAAPAAASPLPAGTPHLQMRAEAIVGQPSTQLGAKGGAGLGLGWRMTDQLWLVADLAQRAAPGGGIASFAAGLQATLDMTPISPYFELTMVDLTNHDALGYSLATRTGLGADWAFRKDMAIGVVVRTYTPIDPAGNNPTLAGVEAAFRFIFTPGAR